MTGKLLFGCLLFQLCDLFPWIKEIMQEGFIFSRLIQTANDINLEFYLILHSVHTISNTTPLPLKYQTATEETQNELWYEVLEYLEKQLIFIIVSLGYFQCGLVMISTINTEATSPNYRMAVTLQPTSFPLCNFWPSHTWSVFATARILQSEKRFTLHT